ncbi:MAG TPA: Gfo/Idh/MocA family oxidoreductase [Chitinophagaceae bacterium]|nr:Gfo/Idh/MocA family oxidoreductase [Chitinophagaceae bacterium]
MKSTPRKFLRNLSLGAGALTVSVPAISKIKRDEADREASPTLDHGQQHFNMCGYAAPKIETVRIGIVGLGMRGSGAVERLSYIDGAEIVALCDKYPDRVGGAQKTLERMQRPKAREFGGEKGWKALCESNDIDLVYTPTPWSLHTPISVYAMKNGKHAASEVPAAKTLDQCWELVETSEKTRKHFMMLENCCYDFFELLTLNMVRNGMFGEIFHAEGDYLHNLSRDYLFNRNAYADMWRLKENIGRNGNLYPTHGLGPIAQCMNINRGDKLEQLVSMSTNDFTLNDLAKEMAAKDPFFNDYVDKPYRGNMNTTFARTHKGKSIMIQHDVSSPRPYSRLHVLNGTKGSAIKWPSPERISFGDDWINPEELKELYDKYSPPIVKHIGAIAKNIGGHGGMDFMMDWRLIDCLRNGLPLDENVYDAATWSGLGVLSEISVTKKSRNIDFPDFTRGSWKTNQPHDMTLNGGATTKIREIKPQTK